MDCFLISCNNCELTYFCNNLGSTFVSFTFSLKFFINLIIGSEEDICLSSLTRSSSSLNISSLIGLITFSSGLLSFLSKKFVKISKIPPPYVCLFLNVFFEISNTFFFGFKVLFNGNLLRGRLFFLVCFFFCNNFFIFPFVNLILYIYIYLIIIL